MTIKPMVRMRYLFEWCNDVASQYPLPRKLLFKTMLEERTFLEDWNKGNVVKVHKIESKNLMKKLSMPQYSSYFK